MQSLLKPFVGRQRAQKQENNTTETTVRGGTPGCVH